MDFYEALKFLADRAQVKLKPTGRKEDNSKDKYYNINKAAANFYHYVLTSHPKGKEALAYFKKERGLKDFTIKTFQLGYSPEPTALISYLTQKKNYKQPDLERVGLTARYGGRVNDRFSQRVIFPLKDHRGNIRGFAGRLIKETPGRPLAKYINSPDTPIYHKTELLYGLDIARSDIKKTGNVVVVEGELDVISSWQAGIRNTVAIKGTALTEDQLRLLDRFTKTITLALDSDVAGDTAALRGITVAENLGLEMRVARLGKYKDPDDMARKNVDEYTKAIVNAVAVWDFILEIIFAKYDANSGSGKTKISREVIPVLARISDKIVQSHYVGVVAGKLKVPEEVVIEQLRGGNYKRQGVAEPTVVNFQNKQKEKTRRQLLEERLLALGFGEPDTVFKKVKAGKLIKTPLYVRIYKEYSKYSKKK